MKIGLIIKNTDHTNSIIQELNLNNQLIIPYNLATITTLSSDLDLIIVHTKENQCLKSTLIKIKSISKLNILIIGPKISLETKTNYLKIGAKFYLEAPNEYHLLNEVLEWLTKSKNDQKTKYEYKDISLDPNSHTLHRQENKYRLPNKEYQLMELFLRNPNQILSRQKLLEEVWDFNEQLKSTTIETHICNLRKKLDKDFSEKRLHTIPYSGYILK